MSLIQHPADFQPTEDSRKKWLYTRKFEQKIGVLNFPGYYKTDGYSTDSFWFTLAISVEIVAVIITILGGFSKGLGFGIGSVIIVALFVFFDVLGAKLVHKYVGEIQKIKNAILIESDINTIKGHLLNISTLKTKFSKYLGVFLIILSSLLKVFAIFILNRFPLPFISIMVISYLLVIYIHIIHSGYWLAEYNLRKSFKKEYNLFALSKVSGNVNPENISKMRQMPFTTNIPLSIDESLSSGAHKINNINSSVVSRGSRIFVYSPENNGSVRVESYDTQEGPFYNYMLDTIGVLTDEDIMGFTHGQNTGQASIIALACLDFQIQNP